MPEAFARLAALLARLEDELPYVTVDDLCRQWVSDTDGPSSALACQELVAQSIADRRLFTDQRQRLDPATGTSVPVRLVRLNRRHPEVAALLSNEY